MSDSLVVSSIIRLISASGFCPSKSSTLWASLAEIIWTSSSFHKSDNGLPSLSSRYRLTLGVPFFVKIILPALIPLSISSCPQIQCFPFGGSSNLPLKYLA